MTEPTPDPLDEFLGASLRAEAEGVEAGPALLDRIRSSAAMPAHRRRGTWLAAAAIAMVAGLGAVALLDDDGEQTVDVAADPSSTTTTTTTTTANGTPPEILDLLGVEFECEAGEVLDLSVAMHPDAPVADLEAMVEALAMDPRVTSVRLLDQEAAYARFAAQFADDPELVASVAPTSLPSFLLLGLVDGADETDVRADLADQPNVYALSDAGCTLVDPTATPPVGQRPTLVALVRDDGMLMTVDLDTGEQVELYAVGDPNDEPGEGGPYFVDAVDLSADGEWIFFSTCCEPASGNTYRIATGGGEVDLVAVGADPRVSADGRYLATGAADQVIVTDLQRGEGPAAAVQLGCCISRLAWSPDGTRLAFTESTGAAGVVPQVRVFDWDGTSLTEQDLGKPDNPGWFVAWTPDGTPVISAGGPIEDDRSLSQDASHTWLLWVDEAGVVREQAGMKSGDRTPIDGLPLALAADW